MNSDRWNRIDVLFDQVLRVSPPDRETWLREACGGDDALFDELRDLVRADELAQQNGFLNPIATSSRDEMLTSEWPLDAASPGRPHVAIEVGDAVDTSGGFTPRAAIHAGSEARSAASPSLVRARLRELPIIYMLLIGIMLLWTHVVIGHDDVVILIAAAAASVTLGSLVAVLSSRREISSRGLQIIELGMTVLLASLMTLIQFRLMREYSLLDDRMLAQLTLKNVVLLDCILIITHGLYVPKGWRRAAYVVGPLALLPFATLLALVLAYPTATGWLWMGWRKSTTPRIVLYSLDVMILLIVATGSAFGARTIHLLRRQVAEARRLGQYRLGRQIGAGGMGDVYLAEHLLLKRPCALKMIRAGKGADPKALERFEREVRITATLSHPNTIEIYDYGRTSDGTYYYVMEYLRGLSLEELVRTHGPLPPSRVVFLLRQVCLALREAHAAGLIHRDIKPSNIFAARLGGVDDVAKLLDFGLVRSAIREPSSDLSEDGQILGTPLFMPPEQAAGRREVDGRGDIYSLGAVAYYLLTGRPPFEGTSIGVLISHAHDPVIPPSTLRPDIPIDLERVVLRCLTKDPDERFPDAESLERTLGACACARDWDRDAASRWWEDEEPTGSSRRS